MVSLSLDDCVVMLFVGDGGTIEDNCDCGSCIIVISQIVLEIVVHVVCVRGRKVEQD